MRPNIKTKIFLDSCDPNETKEIIKLLGFLDGQTTNPTLVFKNPYAKAKFDKGEKFSKEEILEFYKKNIKEISELLPNGSVSAEVYADKNTTPDELFEAGKEISSWAPNVHIKYPIIPAAMAAAEKSVGNGLKVNMTLCFNEEQAAAVYSVTMGARSGTVYLSPFIGRLDDKNMDGMSLIENILNLYQKGDRHVQVLAASVRNLEHFMGALALEVDIITAPPSLLKEWASLGKPTPGEDFKYQPKGEIIKFKNFDLEKNWRNFNINDELTDQGLKKFADDWNSLIK